MADLVLAQAPLAFALAGFLMGGQVALEVWEHAPERVLRLVLMSTNPNGLTSVVRTAGLFRTHLNIDATTRILPMAPTFFTASNAASNVLWDRLPWRSGLAMHP